MDTATSEAASEYKVHIERVLARFQQHLPVLGTPAATLAPVHRISEFQGPQHQCHWCKQKAQRMCVVCGKPAFCSVGCNMALLINQMWPSVYSKSLLKDVRATIKKHGETCSERAATPGEILVLSCLVDEPPTDLKTMRQFHFRKFPPGKDRDTLLQVYQFAVFTCGMTAIDLDKECQQKGLPDKLNGLFVKKRPIIPTPVYDWFEGNVSILLGKSGKLKPLSDSESTPDTKEKIKESESINHGKPKWNPSETIRQEVLLNAVASQALRRRILAVRDEISSPQESDIIGDAMDLLMDLAHKQKSGPATSNPTKSGPSKSEPTKSGPSKSDPNKLGPPNTARTTTPTTTATIQTEPNEPTATTQTGPLQTTAISIQTPTESYPMTPIEIETNFYLTRCTQTPPVVWYSTTAPQTGPAVASNIPPSETATGSRLSPTAPEFELNSIAHPRVLVARGSRPLSPVDAGQGLQANQGNQSTSLAPASSSNGPPPAAQASTPPEQDSETESTAAGDSRQRRASV